MKNGSSKNWVGKKILMCVLGVSIIALFVRGRLSRNSEKIFRTAQFSPQCIMNGTIYAGKSLFVTLSERGFSPQMIEIIRSSLSNVADARKMLPGDRFNILWDDSGNLKCFELIRSPWEKYVVECIDGVFSARKDTIPLARVIFSAEGEIRNTLWESMTSAGIEPEAIMRFTDILAYDFDFVTDTRNGDKFLIMYEKVMFSDSVVRIGQVLLAQYIAGKKTHTAVYYSDPAGKSGYYNLAGESMRKSLLKAPLSYRRISSHFSYSRFHPILKIYRPHLGVDYAAPVGTPVVSSGDGVVKYAGWKGGYGNFVHIIHPNSIETMYGHLSKFARGIKKGAKVKQGQVVGYVGATGLATGPHLDYRVVVKGKFVNPEKYTFPAQPPVAPKFLEDYKKYAQSIIAGANIAAKNLTKLDSKSQGGMNL